MPRPASEQAVTLQSAKREIDALENRRAADKRRQKRARKKRRANPAAHQAYKKSQRERMAAPTALAEKRERNARRKAKPAPLDLELHPSQISEAQLRRPNYKSNGRTERWLDHRDGLHLLSSDKPATRALLKSATAAFRGDPVAADQTPLPRRSRRDTAILEAIAKMYGQQATLEQIADSILRDFDIEQGEPA